MGRERFPESFHAAGGCFNDGPGVTEQFFHNHQVHGRIVNGKDVKPRRNQAVLLRSGCLVRHRFQVQAADRRVIDDLLGNFDMKCGSFPVFTGYAYGALHQVEKLLHNGQTETGPFYGMRALLIHAPERREQMGDAFFPDADACIGYIIDDLEAAVFPVLTGDRKRDGAFAGVLDRVGDDIQQDLFDADLVPAEHRRQCGIDPEHKVQPFFHGPGPDHIHDIREHGGGAVITLQDFHAAGLQLCHIQNLVDGMQQNPAGNLNVLRIFAHFVGDLFPQGHLVEADDGIHGCPYLVTHTGEEVLLRLVQVFDLFLLPLNDPVLGPIYLGYKGKQHTQKERHEQNSQKGLGMLDIDRMPRQHFRMEIGQPEADGAAQNADGQRCGALPFLGHQKYIDQSKGKNRGSSAVHPSGREKGQGINAEVQKSGDGGTDPDVP